MAQRKRLAAAAPASAADVDLPAMADTMMELAMRSGPTEAIVMRIAKAGHMAAVVEDLTRLRNYGKKMGLVRAPRPKKDTPTTKRHRRSTNGGEPANLTT